MDFRNIESFLNVDTNEAESLGRLLVKNLTSDLQKIRRGFRDSDAGSICFAAHSIKGASGNLGFKGLSQLAADVETRAREGLLDGLDDFLIEMQILLEKLEDSLSGT